jgi:hypothetical protein
VVAIASFMLTLSELLKIIIMILNNAAGCGVFEETSEAATSSSSSSVG